MPASRRAMVMPGLAAMLAGCSPLALLDATVPGTGRLAEAGMPYGPDPRQRLDVWVPSGAPGPHPLVVWFYGGSWRRGERAEYRFVAEALAAGGVATVIPDYRLYPAGAFPGFLEDAAAAIAWAASHAGALGADPRAIFVAGHSAGAHIALMLALDPRWLAGAGFDRGRLAGAIGLAGPYDFLPLTDPAVAAVFAAAPDLRATQPITFADASAPPLLLLTGAADQVVGPGNALRLAARVNAAGGNAEVQGYPGLGHIGLLTALAPLFRGRAPVADDMLRFIAAHAPGRPVMRS